MRSLKCLCCLIVVKFVRLRCVRSPENAPPLTSHQNECIPVDDCASRAAYSCMLRHTYEIFWANYVRFLKSCMKIEMTENAIPTPSSYFQLSPFSLEYCPVWPLCWTYEGALMLTCCVHLDPEQLGVLIAGMMSSGCVWSCHAHVDPSLVHCCLSFDGILFPLVLDVSLHIYYSVQC